MDLSIRNFLEQLKDELRNERDNLETQNADFKMALRLGDLSSAAKYMKRARDTTKKIDEIMTTIMVIEKRVS